MQEPFRFFFFSLGNIEGRIINLYSAKTNLGRRIFLVSPEKFEENEDGRFLHRVIHYLFIAETRKVQFHFFRPFDLEIESPSGYDSKDRFIILKRKFEF